MAKVILAIHTCDETEAIHSSDGTVYPVEPYSVPEMMPEMSPAAIAMLLKTLDPDDLYDIKKALGNVEEEHTNAIGIAVTALADSIRLRLIEHTPIRTSYEALIFAYTLRQFAALEEIGQASNFLDIVRNMEEAMDTAQQYGFDIPRLP